MKTTLLVAASALALPLAACGPKVPPARAVLDCPATQGDLTRTSVAPDGKTCTYATSSGAEVTLQLVSVQGGVDATLSKIETNLLASRAEPAAAAPEAAAAAEDASASAAGDAARAAKEAAEDTKGVTVDIKIDKDGEQVSGVTRVNLPGVHIVADDDKDSAEVQIGPLRVDAGDDSATIRVRRNVRLRGEPLNPEQRGMRATFIYTGKDLPDGYRFVGYEAGGPKQGPITVAIVKAREDGPDGGEIYPDVKKLVRENGGV